MYFSTIIDDIDIVGCSSLGAYNQSTVAKIAIFKLYTRKYLANGK